jgi:hypothetical protein
MSTAAAHPVHASVAFLRIPQFESLSVTEQAARKAHLEDRVHAAIAHVDAAERLVLDAEEGLAVVFFGEPGQAMDAALSAQRGGAPLQAGLNYGPLALSARGADARVFGDGLSEAASAARFATPSSLLATEAYTKALQASAPDRAAELVHAGDFTDTRVRMHAFFTPDPQRRAMRRRNLAVFALGGTVLILLLGVLGRDIYQPLFRSRPAVVTLDVKPRGEVFVDGNSIGKIPPLTHFEVAPGKHRLSVRSPGVKTYEVNVDLQPGQRLTLTHTFPAPPPPKRDSWRDFKKRLGS